MESSKNFRLYKERPVQAHRQEFVDGSSLFRLAPRGAIDFKSQIKQNLDFNSANHFYRGFLRTSKPHFPATCVQCEWKLSGTNQPTIAVWNGSIKI